MVIFGQLASKVYTTTTHTEHLLGNSSNF